MVISRTPYRISFFGGGTDYPTWWKEHGGCVIGGTIDKYCWISVRPLPPFFSHKHRLVYSVIENFSKLDEVKHPSVRETLRHMKIADRMGLSISHDGDLPARSGMGSSSSFTVGLVNALSAIEGHALTRDALAQKAIHIEQELIRENVGSQDQSFAAYGGLRKIRFHQTGAIEATPIIISREHLLSLESHMLLFFTGISREASTVAVEQIRTMADKKSEMKTLASFVDDAENILGRGTAGLEDFGKLLHETWLVKRGLTGKITTHEVDAAYESARRQGAIGGKLLGAGGGGFLLIYAKPQDHQKIREALKSLVHVPFRFEFNGSSIVFHKPDEVV